MNNEYSTNERAAKLVGLRTDDYPKDARVMAFDMPGELGYECPIHQTAYDGDIEWSEYKGFIWCARCNKDYPSCLCIPLKGMKSLERATQTYLDCIEAVIAANNTPNDGTSLGKS